MKKVFKLLLAVVVATFMFVQVSDAKKVGQVSQTNQSRLAKRTQSRVLKAHRTGINKQIKQIRRNKMTPKKRSQLKKLRRNLKRINERIKQIRRNK